MAALVSPLVDPGTWSYSIVRETVPAGLRYEGYAVRGLRARRTTPAAAVVPALGLLQRIDLPSGQVCVEVQLNPFPIRQVAAAFPWGLPTFYFVFPDATDVSVANGETAPAGEVIRSTGDVTILMVPQDRTTRDPALWAAEIAVAIATAGGNASLWQPFADAVNAATNTGAAAPVLLLDHAGRPTTTGLVDLVFGSGASEIVRTAQLTAEDGGDLQKTVARMNAANPATMPIANLWSTATSIRLRPARRPSDEVQLVRLEEPGMPQVNEIVVTPGLRHVMFTNLNHWFAPQFATPVGQTAPSLQPYTRGNKVTPFVNGPEFFDDFFKTLGDARFPGCGLHLTGWSMFPETEFTKNDNVPKTLLDAARAIGAAGGGCRFLPARFIQLPEDSEITDQEILAFQFLLSTVLIANSFGVSFVRTDSAGVVIMLGLMFANAVLITMLFETSGRFLEPNEDAVDTLNIAASNSVCLFSPYPATVADNTAVPQPVTGFPFDTLFKVTRHLGCYHQKFAVVRTPAGDVGYCGGMDPHPNRLDDVNHLFGFPYHDVHARVDGPAVDDLEISFAERWNRDSNGGALAFVGPGSPHPAAPGADIVQVARTYFAPADPARRLDFAPDGDRTIADDILNGIRNATEFIYIEEQYFNPPSEYNAALVASVSRIRKLVIVVPSVTDQAFGDLVRSQLVADLRAADFAAGGGIVHIGYPRRRYTVSDNELRTSSGKCVLGEDMPEDPGIAPTIVMVPESRVPVPPFWVAVGGELMWAYDESTVSKPPNSKRLRVERGDRTRLFKTADGLKGSKPRLHRTGAPATVIDLTGIYVHAKLMIVDDAFLSIGSANLNRRGLYHDGEINIFSLSESLKAAPGNPIAALRRKLWAEMLDLPLAMAEPLLEDPVAAARLFRRSPMTGNRFVDPDAFPATLFLDATTGDTLISTLLRGFVFGVGAINHVRLFDAVLDPSSRTETA